MPLWEGKSKGNKTGYQFFVGVLKLFGVKTGYFILKFVVLYFYVFSFKSSKILYSLFHKKLGYNRIESILKVYRNYYKMGQCIIDKIVVMSGLKNNFTYNFEGEENLKEITTLQNGGILISAHIGNWDIAGHLLKRLDSKINIVMFDGEQTQIKEYLKSVSEKKNVKIIYIKNDLSHIYEISESLKNNELVCMHADRFIEGNKTIEAIFLGEKAKFPKGPFLIASIFKVPISFVFALKENNMKYHFFASKLKTYSNEVKEIAMQKMLNDFVFEMELKVIRYPEQWFNHYNFWA
ncbi:MAG: lysophospholipid acyltransferase family protein [Bacteroidetes bacterium]|nr:lysophospholipid acyltransferase family protein [Bacteroidota bacterium]